MYKITNSKDNTVTEFTTERDFVKFVINASKAFDHWSFAIHNAESACIYLNLYCGNLKLEIISPFKEEAVVKNAINAFWDVVLKHYDIKEVNFNDFEKKQFDWFCKGAIEYLVEINKTDVTKA